MSCFSYVTANLSQRELGLRLREMLRDKNHAPSLTDVQLEVTDTEWQMLYAYNKKINMLMKCNRSVMIMKKCKKKSEKW